MKLYEIVEKISTATNVEQAKNYMAYARKNFPEFNFIMNLNDGKLSMEGVPITFNPPLKNKEQSEFGKSIGWFWKSKTPFSFLMTPSTAKNYDPAKKKKVLLNMMNSIPFLEVQVFLTALRGELVDYDGEVNRSLDTQKFKGILAMLSEKKSEEKSVKVEPFITDNIVDGPTVSEELVVPEIPAEQLQEKEIDKQEVTQEKPKESVYVNPTDNTLTWKGKGRKPKWIVEYLNAGGKLEDLLK